MSAKALSAKLGILQLSLLLGSCIFCSLTALAQSTPSNSAAAHRRTYRNQEYGFEVKVPPGFNISRDSGGYIVFRAPHAGPGFGLCIGRPRHRDKLTLPEFVHDDTAYEKDHSFSFADESMASGNGMTIYRFRRILGSSARQGMFFLRDQDEGIMADYLIEYDRCNGGGCGPGEDSRPYIVKDPHASEYDQILSTFRFIKPASPAGTQ